MPRPSLPRKALLRPTSLLLAAALLPMTAAGCAHTVWPEEGVRGDARQSGALPTTLFMRPTDATGPCAAVRLALAMGVSRRGYYVLALPPGVRQAFLLEAECREHRDEAPVVHRPGEPMAECTANEVLHLELVAGVRGPKGQQWGPITFTGRQRAFPGPPGEGCTYELEPEAALRKRAAEAVGWRLPPGTVAEPGTDPRILTRPADAAHP